MKLDLKLEHNKLIFKGSVLERYNNKKNQLSESEVRKKV